MKKTRWLILLYCLSLLLALVLPVYANPMTPTMTEVFITQNGIPVDDNVAFSLVCHGKSIYRPGGLNLSDENDAVYAYTATCIPAKKCYIYKPDTPWKIKISHCDLSGTYKGQPFLLKNFSTIPMESTSRRIMVLGNQENVYTIPYNAESACYDQRYARDNACHKKYRDINTSTGYDEFTPDFSLCQNESTADFFTCIKNNSTWINKTVVEDASQYYELRFDIPSDNKTMGTGTGPGILPGIMYKNTTSSLNQISDPNKQDFTFQTTPPTIRRSPLESLYCSILSIFNASC